MIVLHEREGDKTQERRIKFKGAHGDAFVFLASSEKA
jgi:hypothetical protein